MHFIFLATFLLLLSRVNCNVPETITCAPNNTESYVEEINLSISPFPINLKNGESVAINFGFTVEKEIPVGSTVQIRLVQQGAIPTPLPCFPVILMSTIIILLT